MLHAVGINDRRPILEFTEDEWDHILRVNLSSVFGLAQAAGRHMVERGYGRVLALCRAFRACSPTIRTARTRHPRAVSTSCFASWRANGRLRA